MGRVILLVDDDADFTLLVQNAFARRWSAASPYCVRDGEEAIHYLLGRKSYSDRERFPIPSLVLLDLRMPRASGFEFLDWKREHPELNSLPVVVWSSSNLAEDTQHALSLGAVAYLVKPIVLEDYTEFVGRLKNIWELPLEIRTSLWLWAGLSKVQHTLTVK